MEGCERVIEQKRKELEVKRTRGISLYKTSSILHRCEMELNGNRPASTKHTSEETLADQSVSSTQESASYVIIVQMKCS